MHGHAHDAVQGVDDQRALQVGFLHQFVPGLGAGVVFRAAGVEPQLGAEVQGLEFQHRLLHFQTPWVAFQRQRATEHFVQGDLAQVDLDQHAFLDVVAPGLAAVHPALAQGFVQGHEHRRVTSAAAHVIEQLEAAGEVLAGVAGERLVGDLEVFREVIADP